MSEDTKVINHAKCLFIAKEGISGEDAHHRLDKESMDLSLVLRQDAEKILAAY